WRCWTGAWARCWRSRTGAPEGNAVTWVITIPIEYDPTPVEELRKMTIAEKWRRVHEWNQLCRERHAAEVRRLIPGATAADIHWHWILVTWGEDLVGEVIRAGHDPLKHFPVEPTFVVEGRSG